MQQPSAYLMVAVVCVAGMSIAKAHLNRLAANDPSEPTLSAINQQLLDCQRAS